MQNTIARQLAEFTCHCQCDNLPDTVIDQAKLYILDTLGAIQAGVSETSTQIIADILLQSASEANCTVVGRVIKTSCFAAAMINGAAAHAVEIDDDHRQAALHPGAVVIPAALAAIEHTGSDGKTFIASVVAGYEVAVRVGMAMGGTQDRVGFHSTSTCGVFGAAAAASVVLGLSQSQVVAALGIAGSQACGLQEWKADGSWTKRFHAGKAAEAGLLSAMMAMRGYTGTDTVFEGNHGFLKAFSGIEKIYPDEITKGLGVRYLGAETAFKPFASCRFSHPMIDAIYDLKKKHGFTAQDVKYCKVRLYRSGFSALFEPTETTYSPGTVVDAQFSAPYIAAIALIYDTVFPAQFSQELINNPEIQELMGRVHGHSDEQFELSFPDKYGTEVTIELNNNNSYLKYIDVASGDPAKPEYAENQGQFKMQVIDKYRHLLAGTNISGPMVEGLIAQIGVLEQMTDLVTLSDILGQTP